VATVEGSEGGGGEVEQMRSGWARGLCLGSLAWRARSVYAEDARIGVDGVGAGRSVGTVQARRALLPSAARLAAPGADTNPGAIEKNHITAPVSFNGYQPKQQTASPSSSVSSRRPLFFPEDIAWWGRTPRSHDATASPRWAPHLRCRSFTGFFLLPSPPPPRV
jgi:hypothetical protein